MASRISPHSERSRRTHDAGSEITSAAAPLRRIHLLLALLVFAVPVLAHAGSGEDADAGRAAAQRRDWPATIRLYSAALDRGDLPPETQATAHNNRGIAYAQTS